MKNNDTINEEKNIVANKKPKIIRKKTSAKATEFNTVDMSNDDDKPSIPEFYDYSSYNFVKFFGINSVQYFDTLRHEEILSKFCDKYKKMQTGHIIYKDLKFRNVLTLQPKGWLDDNVINSYFDYLNSLENNSTFFVHPFLFGVVNFESILKFNEKSDDTDKKEKYFTDIYENYCKKYFNHQGNVIMKYERVFFAVHKKPDHWVSIVVETNGVSSNITYYDSIYYKKDTFADGAIEFVEKVINQLEIDSEKEKTEFLRERSTTYPQQVGSNDCGIFVCMLANDFFTYSAIKDTCQQNVAYFRLYLLFLFIEKAGKQLIINQAISAVTDKKVDFDKNLKEKTDNKFLNKIEDYNMFINEDVMEYNNHCNLIESVTSFIKAIRITDDIMEAAGNNLQRGVIQYLKNNLNLEAVEEVGFIEHFSRLCVEINLQVDQIINDAKYDEYELNKIKESETFTNEIVNSKWRLPLIEDSVDITSTQVDISSQMLSPISNKFNLKLLLEKKKNIKRKIF